MSSEDDRRRTERVEVNREFAGGASTYVSDLSEHGVFLHTSDRVPIGTNLELRFTVLLDDPVTVEALGTVVRHQDDPAGMGVQFGPLSPAMVLRINDAISRMRPRDSGPPVAGEKETLTVLPTHDLAARQLTDDEFLDAKTGRFAPVRGTDLEMAGGHAPAEPSPEAFEDEKTLFRLKPVDVEIVDDDEPELD